MAFFLLLGFASLWFVGMCFVSKTAFRNSKTHQRSKRALLTFCLSIAPFAHEVYVYYGFQLYCEAYGGVAKLEPVYTDSLAFSRYVDEYRLLGHPALKHTKYVGTERNQKSLPLSIRNEAAACNSEIHKTRINSSRKLNRDFANQVVARGFCYSNEPLNSEPIYLLKSGPVKSFEYQPSKSALYPREVRHNVNLELIDIDKNKVMSRYVELWTKPGFLTRTLIPMLKNYKCPTRSNWRGDHVFPYQSDVYAFLNKAILKDR